MATRRAFTEHDIAWVAAWKKAGPALERIRNEELRRLSDDEGTAKATWLGVPLELIQPRSSTIGELSKLLLKSQNRVKQSKESYSGDSSSFDDQEDRGDMAKSTRIGQNNILQTAATISDFLKGMKHPFSLIGGVAFLRWGEPRQTVDVDAVLFAGFGNERSFVAELTDHFKSRVEHPIEFGIQNRIVLLETSDGIGVDISLGGLPYDERMIARSSAWKVPKHGTIRTCSAEDLVVLKSVANRPQDWIDIERVIIRQSKRLNRILILDELEPLVELKEEPEILDHLKKILKHHD